MKEKEEQTSYDSKFARTAGAAALFSFFFSQDEESEAFFFKSAPHDVTNRAVTLEYNANNPIEDRIVKGNFKVLKGYVAAVLDGHGGHQVADYVSKTLIPVIEYYIMKETEMETKEGEETIDRSFLWGFGNDKRSTTTWDTFDDKDKVDYTKCRH